MPKYIFVYLGGEYPADPEAGQQHFARYQSWLRGLGGAVLSPAIPCKDTHTVQADGTAESGSISAMSGMSVLQFPSMADALGAAKACPFLEIGGALEVSELVEMTPTTPQDGATKAN